MEKRLQALEAGIQSIEAGLSRLLPAQAEAGVGRKPKAAAKKAAKPEAGTHVVDGMDPIVTQQALMAGVSPDALREMAAVLGVPAAQSTAAPPRADALSSEEEEEDNGPAADGSGSQDPLAKAVISLSKIVKDLRKDKVKKKDKGLETILDRAESGSGKDYAPAMRSKAGALRALQQLLSQGPKADLCGHRTASTRRLGISLSPTWGKLISCERKRMDRVQIQDSVLPQYHTLGVGTGGIWDCLRQGRHDEARARAALGVAMLDQQSCDQGGWLLASELSLEPPPPYSSFSTHTTPSPWEVPHTRLIDGRWYELILSRLRDLAEYQEKKMKLTTTGSRVRAEETPARPEPKVKAKVEAEEESLGWKPPQQMQHE